MFDFVSMITRVRELAGAPVVLAAPFELPDELRTDLLARGLLAGTVLDRAPPLDEDVRPGVAGWWLGDGRREWWLLPTSAVTIAMLGAREGEEVPGPLLFEAWSKGYRRLLLTDDAGAVVADVDLGVAIASRLEDQSDRPAYGTCSYEEAFAELFELVGDRLRLPPEVFETGPVLLLSGSLQPGGAERQLAYTAAGLAARGEDVVVACNHLDPPRDFFKAAVESAGVPVRLVPSPGDSFQTGLALELRERLQKYDGLRMSWGVLYEIWSYALLLREVRPRVVHTWMDHCGVLGGAAAALVGAPRLVLAGRSLAPTHFPHLFQPYMRSGYRALLDLRPLTLLNNSATGARDYERWIGLPQGVIRVVNNGFDFPEVDPSARLETREALGVAHDATLVGSITRFTEEKNARLFVRAAMELHARRPDARFVAYGDGPELEELRADILAAGLSDVIKLPGLVPSPWPVLAALDVFVLTSRAEGLPNVLIEAQAAGVPVVCTAVGGMSETYVEGQTGVGVPEATPASLADAMQRLIDDEALRRCMGEAAREHARASFSLDRLIDATLDVYARAPIVTDA